MLQNIATYIVTNSDVWAPVFFLMVCYSMTLAMWYSMTMNRQEDDDGSMIAGGVAYGWIFALLTIGLSGWQGHDRLNLHWFIGAIIGTAAIVVGCFLISKYRDRIRFL